MKFVFCPFVFCLVCILEFLHFVLFVFCSICVLFHLYFVAFVFCYICILAICILFFCILLCLYFGTFVFCPVVFCYFLLYFALFVLWNICILTDYPNKIVIKRCVDYFFSQTTKGILVMQCWLCHPVTVWTIHSFPIEEVVSQLEKPSSSPSSQ